jgi:hypothetical protein
VLYQLSYVGALNSVKIAPLFVQCKAKNIKKQLHFYSLFMELATGVEPATY